VLEHLDVLGIDRLGIDRDRLHDQVAGHLDRDHAPACRGLHHLVLERLLGGEHVLLHLLGLLEDLLHVRLGHQPLTSPSLGSSSKTSSASNSSMKRRTSSSPESTWFALDASSSRSRSS